MASAACAALLSATLAVPSDLVPRAHTPTSGGPIKGGCGYTTLPPPVLANCTDPISPGVPDLRGNWLGAAAGNASRQHWERIEQCADRVTITSTCVCHDFPHADGTLRNGVHDVSEKDCIPILVAGVWNATCLALNPFELATAVTRCITAQGTLAFNYGGTHFELRRTQRPYGVQQCDQPAA
eukprot:TRINITY_DN60595_c0_g1_i1.p2 TRINITY_DN60595_c0_g1~~TRINITY_DN60595_c0_g1_i1.p2  ORF type:complete len:182 (+),score=41.20 TRINITY_DN60595_c0_g1_i1:72-617(+)